MKILKFISECIRTLIIFVILTVFAFGCAAGIVIMNQSTDYASAYTVVKNAYLHDEDADIYYDDEKSLENAKQVLSNVYTTLPNHIVKIIKSKWTVVVSDSKPFESTNMVVAAGITYSRKGVVWVVSDFDEDIFVHEAGHILDTYLGHPSSQHEFTEIYNKYWETYREFDKDKINKHSVSSNSEFFAMLFSEFILHSSSLKEQAPDAYAFFERLTVNDWRFSDLGHFVSVWLGVSYNVIDVVVNVFVPERPYPNADSVVDAVNKKIANNDCINLDNYQSQYDISWMSKDTHFVAQTILDLAKNPDAYPCEKHGFSEGYLIKFDYPWSVDMYTEILSFTSAYFGDEGLDPVDVNVINGARTEIIIKHDVVALGEANRLKSLTKIEEVLKTLKSGTNTEIAVQVANYICTNASYKLEKYSSFNSFWDNKQGDCVMYALVFKQFMDRLGIENDLIHIVSDQGEGHVYNRIFDGEHYRYYDLTDKVFDVSVMDKSGYHINTWQVQ